jgi:hypothetical protein
MRNLRAAPLTTIAAMLLAVTVTACGEDSPDPVVGPGPSIPLRLESVSPSAGGAAASTRLSLRGIGFQQGATLTIGGISLALTIASNTSGSATAPPHAAGAVDIVITNPNGDRSQLIGGFRYVDIPVKLEISGNRELRAVGETSQLTAIATLSDGTTADVTSAARWFSSFPWIATVSSTGVVTSTGLGLTPLIAQYPASGPAVSDADQVTVTPAGSFALSGRVREPGSGSIERARVEHLDSGQAVESNTDGYFWFGGLTGRPALKVTKVGYEDSTLAGTADDFLDAPIQRVVHLPVGADAYSSTLAPNDLTLAVGNGTECRPCRVIRVKDTTSGVVQITLRWSGPATLVMWVKGRAFEAPDGNREITADVEVGDGDTLVFVGSLHAQPNQEYIPFSVVARR